MMKKLFLYTILMTMSISANGQLNQYKYLVVPVKFDAFNKQNQHKTSTMTKYCLVEQGFNVVYNDNLPMDLKQNGCLGLYVDLQDDSNMFTTKLTMILNDCDGVEVYRTNEGKSKEKEYEKAYKEAIVDAINSMRGLNYAYDGQETKPMSKPSVGETVVLNMANDIKRVAPTDKEEFVIEQKNTQEEQIYKSEEVKNSNIEQAANATQNLESNDRLQVLYAQPVTGGYQLVDTTPKVVYKLVATSLEDIFLVEGGGIGNGLLYKKEGKWMLEYHGKNGKTIRELDIKF